MTEKPEFPPVDGHDDEDHEPRWIETESYCEDCGSHSAIRCLECDLVVDIVWGGDEVRDILRLL